MRTSPVQLALLAAVPLLLSGLAGCGSAAPTAAALPVAHVVEPPPPATAPGLDGAPPRAECDAFLDVVTRTTTLRTAIHRDIATAPAADEWATRTTQLASETKALPLTQEDLVIEAANLATRMGQLATDLRAFSTAQKGRDPSKTAAAQKRVMVASEQVEVLTREPAARCGGGDLKKLKTTAGRLSASAIQSGVQAVFPLVTSCHAKGLLRDPSIAGRVIVRFVIGTDGKVTSAEPISPEAAITADALPPSESGAALVKDAAVIQCVVDTMKTAVFPRPDGGVVTVVYPITFSTDR